MTDTRRPGTLQIDVDDLWVYYESIGLPTPAGTPAQVYIEGIPRLLDLFDRYGIRATFFVCGRDLTAGRAPARGVAEIARRGHEIANHSTGHRNGFARLSPAEKRADIAETGDAIAQATGQRPVGFKAPGFSFSPDLLAVLVELGYRYDSSLLPTPYAPLMRGLQAMLSRQTLDPTHYGAAVNGLAPLAAYHPDPARPHRPLRKTKAQAEVKSGASTSTFWEAPVTTVPLLRLPMHSTFVLRAGRWLFDFGLALVKLRRVPVNYLLHGADVLDAWPDPALHSYGFISQAWEIKRPLYEHLLAKLSAAYRLMPTRDFLETVR